MSVIPPEIRKDINKYSGFIDPDSKYAGMTMKGLFRCPANVQYLSKELYSLLTHPGYVLKNLGDNDNDYHLGITEGRKFNNRSHGIAQQRAALLIKKFKQSQSLLNAMMEDMIEAHPLPPREDLTVSNPVQQLHQVNMDFLLKSSHNIIQSPDTLIADVYATNPDTGTTKRANWDYDASSWSDGTWHPEHLFTNSERNRDNPYWVPLSIERDSDSQATGVGHRYNSSVYAQNNRQSQFPGWRTAIQHRAYERNNTEGFREGAGGDRRTQGTRGFDMSALVSRSTY